MSEKVIALQNGIPRRTTQEHYNKSDVDSITQVIHDDAIEGDIETLTSAHDYTDQKIDEIPLASSSVDGLMSLEDKSKMDGIATGATANATNAQLRDRATHTGTQLSSTISNFSSTVLATLLTGISFATGTPIVDTDSLLSALGKIQKQLTTNTANIATNTSSIATNTSNIGTNTSNIATNTASIANIISTFAANVRSTVLTGLDLTTSTVITTTDSVLSALGKLQSQISLNTAKLAANDLFLQIMAFRKIATNTVTSASTLTLTSSSNFSQTFTGTVAGQIVKLPDATTLSRGHSFEIWNFSSQAVTIQDSAGTQLAVLKANAQTNVFLRQTSTAAGLWALSYTLDSGNTFGTQAQFVSDETETSNTSLTTYATKVTLTTPSDLALGDYMINFQFLWRAANANRAAEVRITQNGTEIIHWTPFYNNVSEKPLLSGFKRIQGLQGANTFTLEFRVSGTATTVYMSESRMYLWRIA